MLEIGLNRFKMSYHKINFLDKHYIDYLVKFIVDYKKFVYLFKFLSFMKFTISYFHFFIQYKSLSFLISDWINLSNSI
jgi:hypothetical protein